MRLHAHRSADAFLAALKSTHGAHYAIFERSATSASVLREVETVGNSHSHTDVAAEASLRAVAERLLRDYFDAAARADTDATFAYSSRVLLAVPDYPDVALLFMVRALKAHDAGGTVHALIADPWKAALVDFDVNGGTRPAFVPPVKRGLARAARSVARSLIARRTLTRPDVLIFTLGDALSRDGPDTYFGDLAASLRNRCAVATVYLAPGKRLRLLSTESVAPLEAFLERGDARTVYLALRSNGTAGEGEPDALTSYLRGREHASGDVVMLHLMARAFEHMFSHLQPRVVVYPFENRTWEKRLLRAARRHGVSRCVGYQHSSITPRHLALSSAAGPDGLADFPDAIITCGEVTADLIRANIPEARSLLNVGAALRARRLHVPPPNGWGVLAPISSSRAEAWELLRVLHAYSVTSSASIIVRTHPTLPIADLYAQYEWPAHVILSSGRALSEDLAATAFVLYSSSTVALEGMLYDRLPIYLDIGDVPSGNPIQGEPRFLSKTRTAADVAQAIERISGMAETELGKLRREARAYAERYLVEPTPENVERMADAIASW